LLKKFKQNPFPPLRLPEDYNLAMGFRSTWIGLKIYRLFIQSYLVYIAFFEIVGGIIVPVTFLGDLKIFP